ncbi:MAG: lipopolysaccharide biosynthesis protein, partial [Chitinophagales bacterium]
MSVLKRLASQTAIYGFSTILVRVLNYLLMPLHTRVFVSQADYGIIAEMYAYVAFLNVIFMYGMETAFFRFASQELSEKNKNKVFGTVQFSLFISTILFVFILLFSAKPIANALHYPDNSAYIFYFALIIGFDTLVNVPFAKLRLQNKPWKYFLVKLANVFINIVLNVFFLWPALKGNYQLFSAFGFTYNPAMGVSYVFYANLVASAVTFILFTPAFFKLHFDMGLWKKIIQYGLPLVIIGFAGMINETLDRILLKYWLPGTAEENLAQLGIYSAVYKISIFMTLAVQAFRMGAEPFFFASANEKNAPNTYAKVMKYFVIVCCFIFLGVGMFPDIFELLIGANYREGLFIVPILLLANLLLGVYYNQSVWYKLTDKTGFATFIPIAGALVTIVLNYYFIPAFGYAGAAWATLGCYLSMVVLS